MSKSLRLFTAQFGLSFSFKSVYERYKMMNVITTRRFFFIPPITQSMDTFTFGRELLSLSYVMGGIEKSCLPHKYNELDNGESSTMVNHL